MNESVSVCVFHTCQEDGLSWQSEKNTHRTCINICDYILRGNNPIVYISPLCYLLFQLL